VEKSVLTFDADADFPPGRATVLNRHLKATATFGDDGYIVFGAKGDQYDLEPERQGPRGTGTCPEEWAPARPLSLEPY
jgi:hypothetical protein